MARANSTAEIITDGADGASGGSKLRPRFEYRSPRRVAAMALSLALASGHLLLGCGPYLVCGDFPACDGNVAVRCEASCSKGGLGLDCEPIIVRTDCSTVDAEVGVAKSCVVGERIAYCVDEERTTCENPNYNVCKADGVPAFCAPTDEGNLASTKAGCKSGTECHPTSVGVTCVDSPKVDCNIEEDWHCDGDRVIRCYGTPTDGGAQATEICSDTCGLNDNEVPVCL